jgi:hypothetical protein
VTEVQQQPLLIVIMRMFQIPWYLATIIIAIILFIPLILIGYLDGAINYQIEGGFWRAGLQGPVLIIYILIAYPFILRLWERAVEAFQPIISENHFYRLSAEVRAVDRRQEWLVVFVGILFLLLVVQRVWLGWVDQWFEYYQVITEAILFGLLTWIIFISIKGSRGIAKLSKQNLNLNIFKMKLLTPVARLSLGISIIFIGGISIALLFETQDTLVEWQSIFVYTILVLSTILIFYISLWSIHNVMVRVKKHELQLAQKYLEETSNNLKEWTNKDSKEGMEELSSAVAGWAAYEKRVNETPEWPFNATIIRRLFASILAPASIYLIKILSTLGVKISF